MEFALSAICKFASDDSKWGDDGMVKTAQGQNTKPINIGGFEIHPRTAMLGLLGAGALPGIGALSGKMSPQQLLVLAALGGLLGAGGHELYQRAGNPGIQEDDDTPNLATKALTLGAGGAAAGAGAWAGSGALHRGTQAALTALGRNPASLQQVLSAGNEGEATRRLEAFLRSEYPDLEIDSDGVRRTAGMLRQYATQAGMNPADPASVNKVVRDIVDTYTKGEGLTLKDTELERRFAPEAAGKGADLDALRRDQAGLEERLRTYLGQGMIEGDLDRGVQVADPVFGQGGRLDITASKENRQLYDDVLGAVADRATLADRIRNAELRQHGTLRGDLDLASGQASNVRFQGDGGALPFPGYKADVGSVPYLNKLVDHYRPTGGRLRRFAPRGRFSTYAKGGAGLGVGLAGLSALLS